jgi:hypothetical protein
MFGGAARMLRRFSLFVFVLAARGPRVLHGRFLVACPAGEATTLVAIVYLGRTAAGLFFTRSWRVGAVDRQRIAEGGKQIGEERNGQTDTAAE